MAGAMVMLMPTMKDAMQMMPGGSSRTSPDGQFTLNGVTPGEYSLQVQSMGALMTAAGNAMTFAFTMSDRSGGAPPAPPQDREFGVTTITVGGEDIGGVVVVGTRGAKASGVLSFEGAAKPETLNGVRVTAPPVDGDGPTPGFGAALVKDTGAFDVDGLIGGRIFRVANLPKGWTLKRVTLNGEDITDKGVEFKPGEDVTGIDIELTDRSTTVTGSVTDDKGQALKDYTVVIFPEDEAKWTLPMNRWMSSTRPDQDGRFKVSNLPPGLYYAVAVEYVAAGEWGDPEWLARAAKQATRLSLDEGAAKSLELKLSGS
jgi:hypothetical protein